VRVWRRLGSPRAPTASPQGSFGWAINEGQGFTYRFLEHEGPRSSRWAPMATFGSTSPALQSADNSGVRSSSCEALGLVDFAKGLKANARGAMRALSAVFVATSSGYPDHDHSIKEKSVRRADG
jgi:hypothetical protein